MAILDVYHQWDINLVKGQGSKVWDDQGKEYLDFYGGHGVISIGHNHPAWKEQIGAQIEQISYYSNAVKNPLQTELADKLGELSGYPDCRLFMCNSGAEANENALKIASFATGRSAVLAFHGAFHGRSSGAVAATDNPKIIAPFDQNHEVTFIKLNDFEALEKELSGKTYAAVIIEGLQGVGGVFEASTPFFSEMRSLCDMHGTKLILDEVQSGFGRSGKFFAHQHHNVRADLITMAKGMGNGYPVGGVLVSPKIDVWKGMLGTTFGGNHLACAATLAVLEVIESENLIEHVSEASQVLTGAISSIEDLKELRGRGLMLGMELKYPYKSVQDDLLEAGIITGGSSQKNTLRLLPPLNISMAECQSFLKIFADHFNAVKS